MFYLGGTEFPTSREQLVTAIIQGIERTLQFPGSRPKVQAEGTFPDISSLQIDLTGGQIDPSHQPPKPQGTGQVQPGVSVASLQMTANPVKVAAGRVTLNMSAGNAQLGFDRDATGALLLVPTHVESGNIAVEIPHADLEAVALSQAKLMAAQQGAQITQLNLILTSRGPRSLAIEMRAAAKKFFISGVVRITGNLDIDDKLVARLSSLDVKGEGLAMSVAEGFLRGKLKQAEGKEIALASFAAAGLRLRDVRIEPGPVIRVTAAFGG